MLVQLSLQSSNITRYSSTVLVFRSAKSSVASIAESGVRNLNREIGSVMRYAAKSIAMEEPFEAVIKPEHLRKILGPTKYESDTDRKSVV
jgi:ATP-dependent Lon protease